MRNVAAYLLVVLSILNVDNPARAQSSGWDSGLDRFETICHKCIRLKSRIAAGERIPADSLSFLTAEVVALKDRLQAVSGDMNPAQERRLGCIKDMYRNGEIFSTVSWIQLADPQCLPMRVLSPDIGKETVGSNIGGELEADLAYVSPFVSFGVVPDFSIGLGVEYDCIPGRWGVYAKGFSNFIFHEPAYFCLSDGKAEDGSTVWVTGRGAISIWGFTAGAHYNFTPQWGFYAGTGYASRRVFWEDSFGNWVQVGDKSHSGFALESGATYKPFPNIGFLAGITFSPYMALSVGATYTFKVLRSHQ